jgi:von Willebrand factor type D domain
MPALAGTASLAVDRSALGVDNKGNGGHANQEHNDRSQKRPDYFPGAISIANPRGAGINGGLDGNCNFVDANGNIVEKSEEEPATPAPVVPAATPAPEVPAPPAPDSDPTDGTTEKAFARGDPHFKTFGGELYDYHGQCDLVLLQNPKFQNGLGMTIHIRTKIQDFWSSVESVAIKIGDDIIEVAGGDNDKWLWVNGEVNGELEELAWNRFTVAGFLVRFKQSGHTRELNIYTKGTKEHIVIKAYRDFVRVDIPWLGSNNFDGSTGLLGSQTLNGMRVSRDGVTFIEDVNAFGQEWQVLEAEDKLFHNYDLTVVQAPAKCILPPAMTAQTTALRQRRLAESDLTAEKAEAACAHVKGEGEQKACIYDVLATQDINMAGAW